MAKHGWNSLTDYISIHEKTIRFYQKFMETPRVYSYQINTEFDHELTCTGIIFHTYSGTRVRVDIEKGLEIDPSNPRRLRARTFDYTYSANIPNGPRLIRYCSPHQDWEEEGTASHHAHHHKHDFTKNPKGDVTLLRQDEWPHVGEFFEEILGRF